MIILKNEIMKNEILAGVGGAVMLNILHESLKHTNENMPRIDLVGTEALQKSLNYIGQSIDDPKKLYFATLAGDLVSNGAYYSLIFYNGKHIWTKAVALGLAAGVGAVVLPEKLGLDDQPVAKNNTVKAFTIGYYVFGALAAATIYKVLKSKS